MRFHIFLYGLLFVLILPLELVMWAAAMNHTMADTFFARRILMNPLFELPREVLWGLAAAGFLALVNGFRIMFREKAPCRKIHPYCGFFLFTGALFLLLKLPYGLAVATPLTIVGIVVVYSIVLRGNSESFLSVNRTGAATFSDRFSVAFCLLPLITGALLLLQEGFLHWLAFPHSRYFLFLPFLGCLLPKQKQLREFVILSYAGMILLTLCFAAAMIFIDGGMLADVSIASAFLFLEVEAAFLLREFLPFRRNFSVFILLLAIFGTKFIMPPVCDYRIVALLVFLIYVIAENLPMLRKKILSRADSASGNIRFMTQDEYAGQAWGFAAVLVTYLAGPFSFLPVLIVIAAVLVTALFRRRLGRGRIWMEAAVMIAAAFAVAAPGCSAGQLIAAFACAAPMMQAIWQTGALVNQFDSGRPLQKFYLAVMNACFFFLLFVLFFFHASDTLIVGLYFLLTGLIRLGECAYDRDAGRVKLLHAWLFMIAGQVVTVIPGTPVVHPSWSVNAVYAGVIAFFALYFFHTFDRNPGKEIRS